MTYKKFPTVIVYMNGVVLREGPDYDYLWMDGTLTLRRRPRAGDTVTTVDIETSVRTDYTVHDIQMLVTDEGRREPLRIEV